MKTTTLKRQWLELTGPQCWHPFPILRSKASLLLLTGRWQDAEAVYRRNRDRVVAAGDRAAGAIAMTDLSAMLNQAGKNDEALTVATEAYAVLAQLGDQANMVRAATTIGSVQYHNAEYAKAMERYRECLAIAQRIDDTKLACRTLGRIGLMHYDMGENERALEVLDQALTQAEQLHDPALIATMTGNIGNVHLEQGRLDESLACYQRSYRESLQIGDKQSTAFGEGNIAIIFEKQGKYSEAMEWTLRQLRAFREMGDRVSEAVSLLNIGNIHLSLGESDTALARFAEVINLAKMNKDKPILSYALYLTGATLMESGRPADSERHLLEAVAVAEEIGFNHYLCGYLARLAKLYQRNGRPDQALALLPRARELAQAAKRTDVLFDAAVTGALIAAGEDQAKAVELLSSLPEHPADPEQQADLLLQLYRLTGDEARRQLAAEAYRALHRDLPKDAFQKALAELE